MQGHAAQNLDSTSLSEEKIEYNISIQTSKHYNAGSTDSTVSIQLIAEDGCTTEWHDLDNIWKDDFEQSRTDKFTITEADIGRILIIKLRLKHIISEDSWACNMVTIEHGVYVDEFPLYDWIFHEMDIIRGDAILPKSKNCEHLKPIINEELDSKKKRFPWIEKSKPGDPTWMLPRFTLAKDIHNVPPMLRMEEARFEHLHELRNAAKMNTIFTKPKHSLLPIKKLDDYKGMISHFKIPNELKPYVKRWEEDAEQGRQMLNGTNPFALECCKTLPAYCKIKNEHVTGLLKEGKTLDDELKDGRIFIADYVNWTQGLPRNIRYQSYEVMHCADCLALFYAPSDCRFLPIAIQLKPDDENYIFTPHDKKYDWMLAKMFFRCSDTNARQWVYHFLWGHAIVETVATSMFHCLSRTHPMHKLCRVHLQHVVSINQLKRDVSISENSPSNYTRSIHGSAMARHLFKGFDFNDFNLPKLLRKKGLDSDKLENYCFREDGLLLWEAIEKYVGKIVHSYYKTDEVKIDEQVQEWVHDLAYEGFGWMDGDTRGCPTCLNTVEELISFVTSSIYSSTVLHTAVHSSMFELYKFVPNAPGGMRLPIHKKGEVELKIGVDQFVVHICDLNYYNVNYNCNS